MRQLPDSPSSDVYRKFLIELKKAPTPDISGNRFRAFCEADFWAFCRFASSFGKYRIDEKGHPRQGGLWVDEPFVFQLCRTAQADVEAGNDDVWYNHPRFHFKTQIITKLLTIWELLKDPTLTFCCLTYKVDQIGESMAGDLKNELERNEELLRHWPDRLTLDRRRYEIWTETALTILRPAGIREPSFSIHSLRKQPTSGHYRRIIVDDPEVGESVRTQDEIDQVVSDLQDITAIESSDTITRHIGTIWDSSGPQMTLFRRGFYSRRNEPTSCYDAEGKPVLHSQVFLSEWRRKLGPYKFSCQLLGKAIAKGDQHFDPTWISGFEYRKSPRKEREGKIVYVIIDPGGGRKKSDYTVFRVVGFGADKIRYVLDLVRERVGLVKAIDLLLGERMEDGTLKRGLAQQWEPDTVWIETYGGFEGWHDAIKEAMEQRSYRGFKLRRLPEIKTPKENRIALLQPVYEQGKIRYPQDGFGHGSKGDPRDTKQQFLEDEYNLWVPEPHSTTHDDMLDCEAWMVQPQTTKLFRFPEFGGEDQKPPAFESHPRRPFSGISPWVA